MRAQIGEHSVEIIRYLQCSPIQTYNVSLPAYGGSVTVTLPSGYQYYQYGILACSSKPAWINAPYFAQTAASTAPTATISADYSTSARSGTVVVTMGNSRDGIYEIAKINVSQSAVTGSVTAAQPTTQAKKTDFMLVPAAGGKDYINTHGAYPNAIMEYSQPWFINCKNNSSQATFDIADNASENARDGSVKTVNNGTIVQNIRYLQCGKQKAYEYAFDPNGETKTITLPYGYQYIEYGQLTCGARPSWITSVSFTQNAAVMPSTDITATVKIAVDKADVSRSETITLGMGNTSNGTFSIASVKVNQTVTTPVHVSVSPSILTIETGKAHKLEAVLTPANVSNKTVTWTSSNASIATVSNTGDVTGVSPGAATITAKTANGLTATCSITVKDIEEPISVEVSHIIFEETDDLPTDIAPIDSFVITALESDAEFSPYTERQLINLEDVRDYTVVYVSDWISYEKIGTELWIWCEKNTSAESRTGVLTIDAENYAPTMITVKQGGTEPDEPVLRESLYEAIMSADAYQINREFYTGESFDALTDTMNAGIQLFEDEMPKLVYVDETTDAIYEALFGLECDEEDTFELLLTIDEKGTVEDASGYYIAGETIALSAVPKAGYRFSHWVSSDGGEFDDVNSAATTFIMPQNDVIIKPCFYLVGDVDGDGVVTMADAMIVFDYISGKRILTDQLLLLSADVDGDSVVTMVDFMLVFDYISGKHLVL